MVNFKNLAEGWINYVRDSRPNGISEEMKKLSDDRAHICKTCPSLLLKEFKFMGKSIFKYRCGECGCAFPMMTYSKNKKCPKGKWPGDIRS